MVAVRRLSADAVEIHLKRLKPAAARRAIRSAAVVYVRGGCGAFEPASQREALAALPVGREVRALFYGTALGIILPGPEGPETPNSRVPGSPLGCGRRGT
jgi:hypothetical protein